MAGARDTMEETEAPDATPTEQQEGGGQVLRCKAPSLLSKLSYASHIYGLQSMLNPLHWLREWSEYLSPPDGAPNIVKTYECRPHLPVRIFFPKSYDETSPATLPTLFTIHGGGFCIGHIRDDDEWNRAFADSQDMLVIALNYSKAPAYPFPTGLYDLEALLLAILADESLPIDRSIAPNSRHPRTAILGFSAGGNLALSLCQLPSIHSHPFAPAAVLPLYAYLDLSTPCDTKLRNRPYKSSLSPPRGDAKDGLQSLIPTFDWAYIPYDQDLRDPLLSPYFAARENLPPNVCVVATELDLLAHESWRFACRLAKEGTNSEAYSVPDEKSRDLKERVCGSQAVRSRPGRIEVTDRKGEADRRFGFEERWEGGGVKWLLVPDALHAFDNKHIRELMGGEETVDDAERKMVEVMGILGGWLRGVWGVNAG
ncbi:Alpha/Beta hydrolase protein [Podospora aff. communis PSN243]|uniref:Alpha/Beta hydrolase protein n=1 Tax=Podospora aff. communis PSN243 TaxID=3040156 RepID=A0AAV9GDL1_9PEZI|nr:Alpha/Beta hydrolase protein [Podospora aff. communis PSN243]